MNTATDVQRLNFLQGVIRIITAAIKYEAGVAKVSVFCMIRFMMKTHSMLSNVVSTQFCCISFNVDMQKYFKTFSR